ncbi:uncharacterized protein LOC130449611 [Diorhabda sublineata]|uniref:uncharacterized protein LOC130449611 n=1 Tax=Diorhabda sublineata TaxID=1163346 RepID=UPI0024E17B0D|nr:uncharacterized protein LOC130449611 [Diorhabda sublineata]
MWNTKRHCSLRIIPLLMIMLFDFNPLTYATKAHIPNMEYLDHDGQSELHRVVKKKVQLNLPKHFTSVKAQTRSNATLNCPYEDDIRNKNVTFSWSKKQSPNGYMLLTTSQQIFTNETSTILWVGDDKRYLAKLSDRGWYLHIRYTLYSDAGFYQCKLCITDKCNETLVLLKLIEARAKIIGGPFKGIPYNKEVPLRLSCVLENSIEKPDYIFWYHGDRMINYDLEDGATVREGPMGSELIFPKANKTHVGNYSCVPSNAKPDSVTVYYGDRPNVPQGDGNGVEKTHPIRDHIVNMLVLIPTFYLTR